MRKLWRQKEDFITYEHILTDFFDFFYNETRLAQF